MLTNFFKEIEYAIKKLKQLLQIEKILFFTSKNNSNFVKKIKKDCDKIYFKKCKHNAINMFDLYKIYLLLKNEILNYDILSVTGRALKENNVVFIKSGANFQDIIEKFGGLIQNIEEIENFKYTAMLAYNDEITLKDKIKKCKNTIDKQKLIKMLETKKIEAKTNIYDKLNDYHQKYLNCLSACFVSKKNEKINIKRVCPPKMSYFRMLLGDSIGCLTVIYNREKTGLIQIPRIDKRNDYALWCKALKKIRVGYKYNEILEHYYTDVEIVKIT